MAKDYDSKRTVARHMFVTEKRTAKEIAETLKIAQKTIGEWVKKYGWKEERDAKAISATKRIDNLEQIITGMAEKRLKLERQIEDEELKKTPDRDLIDSLRKEIAQVDYAVANWNKSLANVRKESKTTLVQYLQVMEDIFQHLAKYNYQVFLATLDFQEHHILEISTRK